MTSRAIARSQGAGSAGMAHGGGRKGREILMASIALCRRWDMRTWFTLGCDAMATGAPPGHRRGDRIVIKGGTDKGGGALMAGIALRRGRDVIGRFSQCIHCDISTAMASCAIARRQGAGSAGMAHGSRHKGSGVLMASIALCFSRYMAI
jgi:hypothetical protein